MTDAEVKRDAKRAFRIVMREMNSSVRFDKPEEIKVLRSNFDVARTRSLAGLLGGGAAGGLGWRYVSERRFSPIAMAWGAFAGMTIGMFSIRETLFLDLLSIPEDESPFARRANDILKKEMPQSPLMAEIAHRRRELFPLAEDRYGDVVWTEPFPGPTGTFTGNTDDGAKS